MQAEIDLENGFSFSKPEPLFNGIPANLKNSPNYAVSNDGERFLHFLPQYEKPGEGIAKNYTELVVVEN